MNTQKKKKKTYKHKLRLKILLLLLLVIVIIVPLALSPLCEISDIEVTGNSHYKSNEIIEATDLKPGENGFMTIGKSISGLLKLRYNIAEKDILKKCPYVRQAVVKYKIPDKMNILIEERKPFYMLSHGGTYLIIDAEGYIIDNVKSADNYKLPIIKGVKIESYEMGQVLNVDNSAIIKKIVTLIKAIKKADENSSYKLQDDINSIDVSDDKKICFFIDDRIVVNFGDLRDINYRISVLKHILLNNLKSDDKGLLDFTTGDKPVFKQEK